MTTGAAPRGGWQAAWPYAGALAIALAVLAGLVAALGGNASEALAGVFRAAFGTGAGLGQTLNKTTPLLLGSLAVVLGLRAGVFNIGVDGQIYAGAVAATGAAFLLADVPRAVALPGVLLAGLAGGAAWGLLPGLLRARMGVNEIFVTVMLNFVALFLVEYLSTGPWNDPTAGEAITRAIPPQATLPWLFARAGAHAGVLLALAAAGGVWLLLYRTVFGYELRATGDNPSAALVGGVPVARVVAVALVASGALAGLAGAVEVSGFHYRLILGLSPGYGMMAILIAVLSRRHPLLAVPAALGFAALLVGTDSLQRSVGLPASAVFVVQAALLLVLLAVEGVRRAR
ncbi:MAG: ABC transporter permease [Armatimonadota bacterium]|nr:ABC transporter permease [Armatimonadota bacterium]MDW8156103.1 ABC transporter permease [Armatimonadota bacterium]